MFKAATEMIYRLVDFAQDKGLIYPIDRAYFRVVLTDAVGNRAMTRGYFLDELE